ncbi:uncharacterized protein [Procambarus clarkii]|uniref:uncharacterized protein n=1 Tax=Procambarus clarkii TaxID=6728 RepID=UPI0037427798
MVTQVLLLLNATSVIIMTPRDADTGVVGRVWTAGLSTQILRHHHLSPFAAHLSNPVSTNSSDGSDSQGNILFPTVNWRFLHEWVEVPRRETVVLVVGPAKWVTEVTLQLTSRGVFGWRDTLVLAPVGGELKTSSLTPHLPLGLRLLLLQETPEAQVTSARCAGLVKAAQVVERRGQVVRSVGCWRGGSPAPHLTHPPAPHHLTQGRQPHYSHPHGIESRTGPVPAARHTAVVSMTNLQFNSTTVLAI